MAFTDYSWLGVHTLLLRDMVQCPVETLHHSARLKTQGHRLHLMTIPRNNIILEKFLTQLTYFSPYQYIVPMEYHKLHHFLK